MRDYDDSADEQVLKDVREHGWHVVKVLAEGDLPEFAYSIGLFHTFGHAEVLIYGLPSDSTHVIINDLGDQVRASRRYAAGQTTDEFLEGYDCTFRAIPRSQYAEHLGGALSFYNHEDFPAIQLVYPDREGRWPWQDGVSDSFRRHQLVLADAAT
jgi:hypothetical protein